jgi:tetratricopeptide (TPR) repeat protein
MRRRTAIAALASCAVLLAAAPADAASGDAQIEFNLGLAAEERGDRSEAYKRFKSACMAEEGLAEACLRWAELAQEQENTKDVKRALGSAVMLDPEDTRARFELAMMLLAKQDWTWAVEHLSEALPHAANEFDAALLRYYLGYAKYKSGELDEAAKQLALAGRKLPAEKQQRASYYRALIAKQQGKHEKAAGLMERATQGPDQAVTAAAASQIESWTAFPRRDGIAGQVRASIGVNTHPSVAFLDDAGSETDPALQSIFRGDAVFGAGSYEHGFYGMITAYREQNWTELGDQQNETRTFDLKDMNITLFMGQAAYVYRQRTSRMEHELRFGVDAETQFLDRPPIKVLDEWIPSNEFGLFGWAVGGKLWWSMAVDPSSTWSIRLKVEGRQNEIEAERSTVRTRLRLGNARWFLDRTLQLKLLVGGRYDRSYHNPAIIKYDRLLPEGWIDLKWISPWPRLSVLAGVKLKYNWYLNSRQNSDNSFRPTYLPHPAFTDEQNAAAEADYYELTRHDFEWEATAEAAIKTWWKGSVALTYRHRQRLSNLDEAPVPVDVATGERVTRPEYGYTQDVVMLELRQGF